MRLLRLIGRGWRLSSRATMVLIVVAMLGLNLATLTVSALNAAVSGVLSAANITTVAARFAADKARLATERDVARKAAREAEAKAARALARRSERKAAIKASRKVVRDLSQKVAFRAERRAIRETASVFAEALPFLGIAVLAASIGFEVKDACDTARDMKAMQAALDTEGDPEGARERVMKEFDCVKEFGDQVRIPTRDEIWDAAVTSPGRAWAAARDYYDDLPSVSFSDGFERSYEWLTGWGKSLLDLAGLGDEVNP